MQTKGNYINFEGARLFYSKIGNGKKALLTFHGFGQLSSHYNMMSNVLSQKYTVYSFDLFFHGRSNWHAGDKPLTKAFWVLMMKKFMEENSISTFSLAGFSMGGKFAIATLEAFPKEVEAIILMAPDGIKTSFWYSMNNYPGWLKRYLKSVILKPRSFYMIMNTMRSLRMIDKGVQKFVAQQMNSRSRRKRVYYTWSVFSKFQFDIDKIADQINHNKIKIYIYLGKYDKIITEKSMYKFLKRVENYELKTLNTGHNNLIDHVATALGDQGVLTN